MNKIANKLIATFTLAVGAIVFIAFITFVVYLAAAFGNADLNPLHWSDSLRQALAVLWLMFVMGVSIVTLVTIAVGR